MKRTKHSGFTIMELLAVVAVIAVLTAIAIPTFTASLRQSKEAVCAANCRALKGLLTSAYMLEGTENSVEDAFQAHKSEYVCPLDGEIKYRISEGVITVYCTHSGVDSALGNSDKMKEIAQYLSTSDLAQNGTYYNSNSSAHDVETIRQALAKASVNLDSLTTWALRYEKSYPKLYWSKQDVSKMPDGSKIYAMTYTISSGNYNVWQVIVKNGAAAGEVSGTIQLPNVADQTYEKALAKYEELVGK